jgi:hypothetical protein
VTQQQAAQRQAQHQLADIIRTHETPHRLDDKSLYNANVQGR